MQKDCKIASLLTSQENHSSVDAILQQDKCLEQKLDIT